MSEATEGPAGASLDLGAYVPFHLISIANAWSRGASAIFLKRFGVGVHDWAVISTLKIEPGANALRVREISTGDKGSISRSLVRLEAQGMVRSTAAARDPRRRRYELTEAGAAAHDQMRDISLRREMALLDGLSAADRTQLLAQLKRLERNLATLGETDQAEVGE